MNCSALEKSAAASFELDARIQHLLHAIAKLGTPHPHRHGHEGIGLSPRHGGLARRGRRRAPDAALCPGWRGLLCRGLRLRRGSRRRGWRRFIRPCISNRGTDRHSDRHRPDEGRRQRCCLANTHCTLLELDWGGGPMPLASRRGADRRAVPRSAVARPDGISASRLPLSRLCSLVLEQAALNANSYGKMRSRDSRACAYGRGVGIGVSSWQSTRQLASAG